MPTCDGEDCWEEIDSPGLCFKCLLKGNKSISLGHEESYSDYTIQSDLPETQYRI